MRFSLVIQKKNGGSKLLQFSEHFNACKKDLFDMEIGGIERPFHGDKVEASGSTSMMEYVKVSNVAYMESQVK